jgi:hypothetical protein
MSRAHMYEKAVVSILQWLHLAEDDLVGHVVQTFNGEAGDIKGLQLDDDHGLCFTFDDPVHPFDAVERGMRQRWFPVSTIRMMSS